MTLPMKTWMADETFNQPRMMSLMIDVFRQGQNEGILNPHVRAGTLLDFLMGFVQRSFFMWILRQKNGSLSDQANIMFEMVWQGMLANPQQLTQDQSPEKK